MGIRTTAFRLFLAALLAAQAAACMPGREARAAAAGPDPACDMRVNNRIDEFVLAHLKQKGIPPSAPCSDAVFLRRVYLDTIGTLPRPREVRDFLTDTDPGKRSRLIDQLLDREEYADYWSLKWCDLLRVKSEFPSNLWPLAVEVYHGWVREALRENLPYDRFARALLTSGGSNFHDGPVNFYRVTQHDPEKTAAFAALVFMGMRAEKWRPEDRRACAAFFSRIGYKSTGQWKEEIVYYDPGTGQPQPAGVLGKKINLPPGRDPRVVFADWLTAPDNPYFARAAVNRIWYWLMGRGIVEEADDMGPANPPQDPQLLDWLASELVRSHYDLKHIYRLILNSSTYQLSSVPNRYNASDQADFSRYQVRRLDAEVLIDAVCQITATGEDYSSRIPEPFTFIPPRQRTITLADGSIDSAFLALFGRPPRDTGYLSERNNELSVTQRLHFLNSTHIQNKIYRPAFLRGLTRLAGNDDTLIKLVYVDVLSRPPSEAELRTAQDYIRSPGLNREAAAGDLVWALMNTKEFMFRH